MGKTNENLAVLAQCVPIFLVKRPQDTFMLNELVDLLEKDFNP